MVLPDGTDIYIGRDVDPSLRQLSLSDRFSRSQKTQKSYKNRVFPFSDHLTPPFGVPFLCERMSSGPASTDASRGRIYCLRSDAESNRRRRACNAGGVHILPKRRRRMTRTSPAFLDNDLEVAARSHGQYWTPDTGQPSMPVYPWRTPGLPQAADPAGPSVLRRTDLVRTLG